MTREDQEPSTMEELIAAGDTESLKYFVVDVALNEPDQQEAERVCTELASYPDEFVRGNAILGFGHIARRFRSLSESRLSLIKEGLTDPSYHVRGHSHSAASDVLFFLGIQI